MQVGWRVSVHSGWLVLLSVEGPSGGLWSSVMYRTVENDENKQGPKAGPLAARRKTAVGMW